MRTNPPEMWYNFEKKLDYKKYRKIAKQYRKLADLDSGGESASDIEENLDE